MLTCTSARWPIGRILCVCQRCLVPVWHDPDRNYVVAPTLSRRYAHTLPRHSLLHTKRDRGLSGLKLTGATLCISVFLVFFILSRGAGLPVTSSSQPLLITSTSTITITTTETDVVTYTAKKQIAIFSTEVLLVIVVALGATVVAVTYTHLRRKMSGS